MADTTGGPQSLSEVIKKLEELGGAGFNFGPSYFADLRDADLTRLRTAKRLLAGSDIAKEIYLEKLRMWRGGATHCAYCTCELIELRHARAVGTKLLHLGCAEKFEKEYSEWLGRSVTITDAGRAALEHTPGAA
jgi:hypothetical protein